MSNLWGYSSKRIYITISVVAWTVGIAIGSFSGLKYEMTPAATRKVSPRWPVNSACQLSHDRPTLVMFAHPRCPCTRASLDELAELMAHRQDRIDTKVVFFQPPEASTEWVETELWNRAGEIPSLQRHVDRDGGEQRRFAATASGEVFVYLPNGELAFHGGITARRGHSGTNSGRSAIEHLVQNLTSPIQSTPVFGCYLTSEHPATQDEQYRCEAKAD